MLTPIDFSSRSAVRLCSARNLQDINECVALGSKRAVPMDGGINSLFVITSVASPIRYAIMWVRLAGPPLPAPPVTGWLPLGGLIRLICGGAGAGSLGA